MKRFAIFAMLGPPLAMVILFAVLLPVASLLEGQRIGITVSPSALLYGIFPALVVALFDWIADAALRDTLDLPGWSMAIGLLGTIPAFVCSSIVLRMDKRQSTKANSAAQAK
jgi:hypothetical protein